MPWIVCTGRPWRDWPEEFGKCNSVFKRFRDGARPYLAKTL
ncbi:transposase [Ottowia sp. oral taxon 894]